MVKTFQYRLYPTAKQERLLHATLAECRWLYNHFLEEREHAWTRNGSRLPLYDQLATHPVLKSARPSLGTVHSQVLQNVGVRLDQAFQVFYRRCADGRKAGLPRFRGQSRYDSFCYPQAPSGCKLEGNRIRLSKIGAVRAVLHRPLEGQPKTVRIRRSSTGQWYVTIACVVEPQPLPAAAEPVGIDVGLESFATLSTGEKIMNPRFFRREEKALAKAQHRLDREAKGTPQRRKRRQVVARIHQRARWKRRNFAHQQSRRIVNRFQIIAVEDLNVTSLVRNHCLAKSIMDAAWAEFLTALRVKAAWAGRSFVAVNPAFTSQQCSRCGHRQKLTLPERIYRCAHCSLTLDRDENAAANILRLGLQSLGSAPRSSPPPP